jgi:hypothetical protein
MSEVTYSTPRQPPRKSRLFDRRSGTHAMIERFTPVNGTLKRCIPFFWCFCFFSGLLPGSAQSLPKEKDFVFSVVERNREAIALLGDHIFYFAELGMQEFESSRLMTEILEEAGFEIEREISGMPPAFMATYGSGQPVIGFHTEFDSTPGNSQIPGVTEHRPLTEGAPGHAEGHNVNAAVMIGAAFAVKQAMDEFNLGGTLKVFGAPAEEQLIATLMMLTSCFILTSPLISRPSTVCVSML